MGLRYHQPTTPDEWSALTQARYTGNLSLFDYGLFFRDTHMHRNGSCYTELECLECIVSYALNYLVDGALFECWRMFGYEIRDYELIDELRYESGLLIDWLFDVRHIDFGTRLKRMFTHDRLSLL